MPTIVKPQVLVFQEFNLTPSEITNPLRAHISGGNALLHRYDVAAEKAEIGVGEYDRLVDQCYEWPGREAGSIVDDDSVRLFIDDALLLYHEDLIGDTSGGRGTVTPVAGRTNWIKSSTLAYKSNGSSYPRHGLFNDRDVAVGDRVYVRGVVDADDDCNEVELWTYVEGFAAEETDGTIGAISYGTNNAESTAESVEIIQVDGAVNCITLTGDASDYDGLPDGFPSETYTLEVIRSSIAGCNASRLRVTSASGTDDVAEVEVEAFGDPTTIGTRGLTVTFDTTPGNCSLSASSEGVESAELVVGQKWTVAVSQDFEKACAEVDGTYSGTFNDTYILTVTKGGLWADLPEVTVTTAKGLDSSGPTEVTGANVAIPVGSYGVTASFLDCFGSNSSQAAYESEPLGGDSTLAGLRKGDKFYVTVTTGANGAIQTLILRDDLPDELLDATDLDLRLFIQKDIEVTANRLSSPPLLNYDIETTQLCVEAGVTAYDSTWTDNDVELAMPVYGGSLYIEYREWLADLADEVNFISDVAELDAIPGQLDEQNPLKWGVYKALQNSNGTRVGYTAVTDPSDLDAWQDVINRVDGRDDVYNFVPMTRDREVLNLFQAHVESESSPEAGNWKGMFVNLLATSTKMVVGQSSADVQALTPTSTDGEVVLATLTDNPQASGTQYTRLRVPEGNGGFITHGVQAGDIVRYLYTIDAFGTESYSEFVVDSVTSENTLLLLSGHTESVTVAQKIEIWHTLNKNEIVADLAGQAQSFADRRVCAVWPDLVGTAGNTQAGYFLCAALAGLASGVQPHQPLTNVEIAGFDDLASRTKNYFSDTQLDLLDDSGVWIATEDRDGTPHTRHALTTDTTDLKRWEESIRRNVDSISFLFLARLRPYIGRANVTPTLLRKLEYEANQAIKFLTTNGFTDELGSQLISGTIRKGYPKVHDLLADRVEIVLDLVVPAPLNNIEVHLVV